MNLEYFMSDSDGIAFFFPNNNNNINSLLIKFFKF